MLYIVLILVLAALGLLVAALTTASTLWAWLSIAISLAGATLLFLDWLGNRRRAESEPDSDPVDEPVAEEPSAVVEPAVAVAEDTSDTATFPTVADVPDIPEVSDDEPGEEPTDAADLLIVASLTVDVRVVDERPRYHLATCSWLAGRPTLGLPVAEARQLGFTPCARCSPDATLATRHRDAKRQRT